MAAASWKAGLRCQPVNCAQVAAALIGPGSRAWVWFGPVTSLCRLQSRTAARRVAR